MAFEIISLTSQTTLQLVRSALKRAFPGIRFEISLEVPQAPYDLTQNVTAAIVAWQNGPRRESVEDVMAPFQSLEWDAETGVLREAEHFEVTADGRLQRIVYGIDYVVCDGPVADLSLSGPTSELSLEEE
jgi:hypothetical protein